MGRNIKYLVVHCTATQPEAKVESIKRYWREEMKWKQVGYHYLITPDGVAHHLAGDEVVTNGVGGHNSYSLHISYVGGIDKAGKAKDTRTEAQKAAMYCILKEWKKKYPQAIIQGHRDFPKVNKACPSFDAKAWAKELGL